MAAQIPLTSLSDDVTTLRRVLRRQKHPVILTGHSYGGAVITAAGSDNHNVKGLVYVAAVVPDEGETVGAIFRRVAPQLSGSAASTRRRWLLVAATCWFPQRSCAGRLG